MKEVSQSYELVNAVMGFIESRPEKGPDDGETVVNHMIAFVETMAMFRKLSPRSLDSAATKKLDRFFKVAVGDLIDHHEIRWISDPVRRNFVLNCTGYLAQIANDIADERNSSNVTKRILIDACEKMINDQRPSCPLGNARTRRGLKLRPLGTACNALADEIRDGLMED